LFPKDTTGDEVEWRGERERKKGQARRERERGRAKRARAGGREGGETHLLHFGRGDTAHKSLNRILRRWAGRGKGRGGDERRRKKIGISPCPSQKVTHRFLLHTT